MYVTYSNYGGEIIVSTLEQEDEVIQDYFTDGGRVLEDYDREVSDEPVCIRSSVYID